MVVMINPIDYLSQNRLDEFTRAYVQAALWSSTDESTPQGGEPLDKNYTIEDIDSRTLGRMAADCERFVSENNADLAASGLSDLIAGSSFWLSRNGHGSGFFDRDLGALGDKLQAAARRYGEFNLYVGDDGIIHGS